MTETPRSFAMSRFDGHHSLGPQRVPVTECRAVSERAARRPSTRADALDPCARSTSADCNADCCPRGVRAPRIGSAVACRIGGVRCHSNSKWYNPRPERLARRTAPPSIARRDCRTLPRNSRATAAGYRHSPRNRLTRSGPRLKSTRSSSVTGNFTCELFRGSGRRWPYRSSEAARRRPIGWGRHGRVATLSRTGLARDRLVPPPQGSDDRHGSRHQGGPPGGQRRGLLT